MYFLLRFLFPSLIVCAFQFRIALLFPGLIGYTFHIAFLFPNLVMHFVMLFCFPLWLVMHFIMPFCFPLWLVMHFIMPFCFCGSSQWPTCCLLTWTRDHQSSRLKLPSAKSSPLWVKICATVWPTLWSCGCVCGWMRQTLSVKFLGFSWETDGVECL